MKTTKIGLIGLAFFILMTMVMAAPPMPYPVAGKVSIVSDLVPMFEVELTTCDYGSTVDNCVEDVVTKFETDSTGHYIFALDAINPMYRTRMCNSKGVCYTGDFVKIKVCDNHPNCEVIRELTGSALLVDFKLGLEKEVVIEKQTVEDEKIVEVPVKNDDGTPIDVVVAGEPTSLEQLKSLWKNPWFKGFLAMVIALLGIGGALAVKARKMLSTTVKKNKSGAYR